MQLLLGLNDWHLLASLALCAGDQVRELKRSHPYRKRNIEFAARLLVHAGPHKDVFARHAVDVAQLLRGRFLAGLGPHVVDPALALRLRQRDEFLEEKLFVRAFVRGLEQVLADEIRLDRVC